MADQIKLQLSKLRTRLDKYPALATIEDKTKVPKEYLFCGVAAVVFLFLLFSNGAGFLWCVGLVCACVWGGLGGWVDGGGLVRMGGEAHVMHACACVCNAARCCGVVHTGQSG